MEDRPRFVTMFRVDIIFNIALVPAYRNALYFIDRRQTTIEYYRRTKDNPEDDTNYFN